MGRQWDELPIWSCFSPFLASGLAFLGCPGSLFHKETLILVLPHQPPFLAGGSTWAPGSKQKSPP